VTPKGKGKKGDSGKTKTKTTKKAQTQSKGRAKTKAAAPPDASRSEERETGYLVLARRYRPTQFDQVVGQQHVSRTLQNAIEAGRVHHAYLFTGSRGVGKTTVARIMAKALNCDNGPTAHPCDACTSCLEVRDDRSVDVYEIDGASHTGVDDVRELRESVRYLPTRCRHKIYIIDEVHMLSTSAFNALLKTLEEPPAHVVFIFATTEPHKIPATILSRCQRFDFKRVSGPLLLQHLTFLCEQESIAVDRSGLALIARASEGSVRDALSLLDQVIAYAAAEGDEIPASRVAEVLGVADRRVLFDLSRALLARDAQGALEVVDELFTSGQDLAQFARAFLGHLRDLTVVRTCKDPDALVDATEAELQELSRQATGEGAELVTQHFDHFARVTDEIARSSFPRLLLEMAVIEMIHAEPMLPLGDLLQRLEGLEARLGRGSTPGGGGGGLEIPDFSGAGKTRQGRRVEASPRASASAAAQQEVAVSPPPAPPVEVAPARTAKPKPTPTAGSSPSAPASASGNGDAMERWQSLLQRVSEQEPMAASAFAAGKLLSWSGDTIQLGYSPDSFQLDWAKDRRKLEAFQRECSKHAGRKLEVKIREMGPQDQASPEIARLSAMEDQAHKRAERARQLQEEAREHPLTRTLVETFGATIESITTEADEP
jgi:DNA polymerase-3 subunit gamma/tau